MEKNISRRGLVLAAGLVLLGAGCSSAPASVPSDEQSPSLAVPAPGTDPNNAVEVQVNIQDNPAENEASAGSAEVLSETEAQEEQPVAEAPAELVIRELTVSGSSFSFSPSEMRVALGERVRVTFKNTGGFHDWSLEGYNLASSRINEGSESVVEFTADKAGRFNFFCSVGSHRAQGMEGVLVVE